MSLQNLVGRGLVSPRVAKRFAYDSTSADGKRLTRDDGGVHQRAEVPGNHIDHPTNQRPKRGTGFANPGRDNNMAGVSGRGHLDARPIRRTFPSEARMSSRNRDSHWLTKYASTSRAKQSSDSEYYPGRHYGDPPGRQR